MFLKFNLDFPHCITRSGHVYLTLFLNKLENVEGEESGVSEIDIAIFSELSEEFSEYTCFYNNDDGMACI